MRITFSLLHISKPKDLNAVYLQFGFQHPLCCNSSNQLSEKTSISIHAFIANFKRVHVSRRARLDQHMAPGDYDIQGGAVLSGRYTVGI
jgi:hypothetical protein